MRRATPADLEALVDFNAAVHGSPDQPDQMIGAWVRDLLTRPHPTFGQGGFLVVEDPARAAGDRIVSTLNLIPQTWSYGGVPFGVGRVEVVGTHLEYRRRGLVRLQMEEVHRWSAALGHPVQIITGISNFYRQFGYEQGLTMSGACAGYRHAIPSLPEGAAEPFHLRPATVEDAGFLAHLEEIARPRYLLSVPRDAAHWRYELDRLREDSLMHRRIRIIEAATGASGPAGERAGYLVHLRSLAPTFYVVAYELVSGLSWLAVTPSVLRHLKTIGDAYVPISPDPTDRRFERFQFQLGLDHPVYHAIPQRLPETERQFVNYVRVPDLPAFLRHIAPVLERRLAASIAPSHTGRLRLSFYREGVLLRFQDGRLAAAERCPHHTPSGEDGPAGPAGPIGASFPDLTFLQLLFGSRSLAELEHAFGDCRVRTEEARALLPILFPKHPSLIWPVS